MKILKPILHGLITLATLAIILLALIAQIVRDISIFWALLLYMPLLPLGLWAIVWSLTWRGKSVLLFYSLMLIGLVAMGVQGQQFLRFFPQQTLPQQANSIRLLHWNVLWGGKFPLSSKPYQGSWESLSQAILQQQANIIVLSEPPQDKRLFALADQLDDDWQMIHFQAANKCTERCILFTVLSPYPMHIERYINPRHGNAFIVRLNMPQGIFRLLVVDGISQYTQLRTPFLHDIQQTVIEQYEKQQPIDVIVGDFNAVRRSQGFDDYPIMGDGYWLAADKTLGWRGTWKSYAPLFDIDHIWVNRRYQAVYTKFLFNWASDHHGQLVTFYLSSN